MPCAGARAPAPDLWTFLGGLESQTTYVFLHLLYKYVFRAYYVTGLGNRIILPGL